MKKHIQAGTLNIDCTDGAERLDELIGFASRENQKRGFLFVSKVLGKHIPVAPGVMRSIYDELANLCALDQSAYVIGMAETATGLGAGVADSLATMHPEFDLFYQHTTRHILDQPVWFTLDESHSHAVDHIMYQPNEAIYLQLMSVKKIILVDDEITTGRTLLLLLTRIIASIPAIEEVLIVTLVSWLDQEHIGQFDGLGVTVNFIQLMQGTFTFTPNPQFNVNLPDNVDDDVCKAESRHDLGRTGLKMPYKLNDNETFINNNSNPLVVVGTGEHLYYPFLIAEMLAKTVDVLFQSTTRSPILEGDAIKRKICFDTQNAKVNFIYNLPKDRNILIVAENDHHSGLQEQLNNAAIEHYRYA